MYGYDRNTTPHLAQDTNLVVMTDAITQSNTTHKSVSIMLTPASAENYGVIYGQKSILTAFKEVGFTTLFLSNQSANRTFTDYFAQEADYSKYFRFFNENTNNYDEVLLTELQHCMDSIAGNLFIVLYTYGSHFNYHERYPEEFSRFRPDNFIKVSRTNRDMLVNAYDNTILYTDHFLHRLTGILQDTNSCTAFFYSSDHGEDIMDDRHQRFLHASPNPSFYQLRIPMLMWFSPVYKEYFPTMVTQAFSNHMQPVTTNTIFHTLLDMAGIDTPYREPGLSLLSEQFQVVPRMYLGDHDDPVPFHRAGLKPEDKIMLETHHIAY
ncbi:MAG: phosphoethanolamine transferase [Tannerellaceae bacterium]|nr:phosphoethanolamine transferase [Tannerellaceae bacterium]